MTERFHPTSDSVLLIAKHPNGDYVRYSDYASLQAEVERLTDDNRRSEISLRGAVLENAKLRETVASLTQERDAQLSETQRAWNERDGEKRLRLRAEAELAKLREGAEPNLVALIRQKADEYGRLIEAGQGQHGQPSYVRDATWHSWCGKHSLLAELVSRIDHPTTEQTDARSGVRVALEKLERYVALYCFDVWSPEDHEKSPVLNALLDQTRRILSALSPAAPEGQQEAEIDRLKRLLGKMDRRSGTARAEAAAEIYSMFVKLLSRPAERAVTEARRFQLGDRVTKKSGSSWTGRVVGFYSTSLTPSGYAVESENEPGSVQIYPEAALRSLTGEGR